MRASIYRVPRSRVRPLGLLLFRLPVLEGRVSTDSAESYARSALSANKSTDQKIELIAKALIELAKAIGSIPQDISRIKNRAA